MQINKMFESTQHKIIAGVLFILMLGGFIYLGNKNFDDGITDALKFSAEFDLVDEDNVFVYSNAKEVLKYLDKDSIILFGSSDNEFTNQYAALINEAANNSSIGTILYYDFFDDRNNNNGNYELIVEKLKPYLIKDDRGQIELYAPTFLVVQDGSVAYIHEDSVFVKGDLSPDEYWNTLKKGEFVTTLGVVFENFGKAVSDAGEE